MTFVIEGYGPQTKRQVAGGYIGGGIPSAAGFPNCKTNPGAWKDAGSAGQWPGFVSGHRL